MVVISYGPLVGCCYFLEAWSLPKGPCRANCAGTQGMSANMAQFGTLLLCQILPFQILSVPNPAPTPPPPQVAIHVCTQHKGTESLRIRWQSTKALYRQRMYHSIHSHCHDRLCSPPPMRLADCRGQSEWWLKRPDLLKRRRPGSPSSTWLPMPHKTTSHLFGILHLHEQCGHLQHDTHHNASVGSRLRRWAACWPKTNSQETGHSRLLGGGELASP